MFLGGSVEKNNMSIWANTLVQNEDRYLWYSVGSVINYVDKVLIWDTGSTDNTLKVIQELKLRYPHKILFKEVGNVSPQEFTNVRKQMLSETKSDWMMILDGDEVWWDDSIRSLTSEIATNGNKYDSVVSNYINLVGDIYHSQPENAGKYKIKSKEGFFTIRAMNKNKIKGLNIDKPHGQQGFYDSKRRLIQERSGDDMYFIDKPSFLHFTNLQRSNSRNMDLKVPKRGFKLKHEIGNTFPGDFYYPEVFFKKRPKIVQSVWKSMNKFFYIRALIETPLRKIKRTLLIGKSGY